MGIFSWYGFTIRTIVAMIQQKYESITGVKYGADTKRFTHRRCKKLTTRQFLDQAKNNIMSKILVSIQPFIFGFLGFLLLPYQEVS